MFQKYDFCEICIHFINYRQCFCCKKNVTSYQAKLTFSLEHNNDISMFSSSLRYLVINPCAAMYRLRLQARFRSIEISLNFIKYFFVDAELIQ